MSKKATQTAAAIPGRVRKLREAAEMSVTHLAEASGVPARTIRNIESGASSISGPGVAAILAVATALGVTVDGLLSTEK